MARTRRPIKYATPRTPKQKAIRITFHVLVWFGAAILYYVGFSLFFDTPVEYELKHSTDQLRDEYTRLEARYDSLRTVMENVSERDRNVFNILFESDPYDFDTEYETKRLATYEMPGAPHDLRISPAGLQCCRKSPLPAPETAPPARNTRQYSAFPPESLHRRR